MLGVQRPPHPILQPPSPAATHLDVPVHDAQVVEVHWGQDRAISAVCPLPAQRPVPALGVADPACRCPSPLVGTVVAVPSVAGHSPSTSTSSAAKRRTVASAKQPAVRHSACRSPVLQ